MRVPKFIIRDRKTGAVKINLGDRLTKFSGVVLTSLGQAGSLVIPGSSTDGEPWFSAQPLALDEYYGLPKVNLTGNTLTWPADSYTTMLIHYGRF